MRIALFVLMSLIISGAPAMARTTHETPKALNRLAGEKSPYLLDHAHNPVDWYPWGEEAFAKARREDKPVFLSIGYSTCHWCHVMEGESFEDAETAQLLNTSFVAVKVDREERPDIDQIYMSYVIAISGSGGWPLSVFLTPEGKPIYGGTYFPKEGRANLPAFKHVLGRVTELWRTKREDIVRSGEKFKEYFDARKNAQGDEPEAGLLTHAYREFVSAYDSTHGGFGSAPKFPQGHAVAFLLRYARLFPESDALPMVEKTLESMARGGLVDQIGGGFHRYSVDREWFVPHFEKMLYDQAALLKTYAEAYQMTRNDLYAATVRLTAEYLLRDMQALGGAFYSAQDADSEDAESGEAREGAFYVWTWEEIRNLLSESEFRVFSMVYGLESEGNVKNDPHGEFNGRNILFVARTIDEAAAAEGVSIYEIKRILSRSRIKLYEARLKRHELKTDDKILADWNGFLIASLTFASRVLGEEEFHEAAVEAADFILQVMRDPDGRLRHRYRDGETAIPGQLDDYAFMIHGLLELYQTDFDTKWLLTAKELADRMIADFWDPKDGAFYMAAEGSDPLLITRPKEFHDGAMPSGNAVAALDLLILSRFTQESRYEELGRKTLKAYSAHLTASPMSFAQGLIAVDFAVNPGYEIVLAGRKQDDLTRRMLKELNRRFIPNKIMILHPPGSEGAAIEKIAPFVRQQRVIDGKTTAYVCRNYVCKLPTHDPEKLDELLQ